MWASMVSLIIICGPAEFVHLGIQSNSYMDQTKKQFFQFPYHIVKQSKGHFESLKESTNHKMWEATYQTFQNQI